MIKHFGFLPMMIALKVGFSPFEKVGFICFIRRPLKVMKNPFVSRQKLFWFSRYLNHVGKRLDKKAEVNFKIVTSQTEKQVVRIHILPNILRGKGSQTTKFAQLI